MTVCDAVYIPGGETGLIQLTKELGLRAVPGKRMLLYQGVQAQRMWTGKEPDVSAMSDALSKSKGSTGAKSALGAAPGGRSRFALLGDVA